MSNAKKCDRCGSYYEFNKTKHQLKRSYGFGGLFKVIGVDIIAENGIFHRIELCDECIDSLWLDFLSLNPTDTPSVDN